MKLNCRLFYRIGSDILVFIESKFIKNIYDEIKFSTFFQYKFWHFSIYKIKIKKHLSWK